MWQQQLHEGRTWFSSQLWRLLVYHGRKGITGWLYLWQLKLIGTAATGMADRPRGMRMILEEGFDYSPQGCPLNPTSVNHDPPLKYHYQQVAKYLKHEPREAISHLNHNMYPPLLTACYSLPLRNHNSTSITTRSIFF